MNIDNIKHKFLMKVLEQCPDADTEDAFCIPDFYCDSCKEKIDFIFEAIDEMADKSEEKA